jgi:hypothetical protein
MTINSRVSSRPDDGGELLLKLNNTRRWHECGDGGIKIVGDTVDILHRLSMSSVFCSANASFNSSKDEGVNAIGVRRIGDNPIAPIGVLVFSTGGGGTTMLDSSIKLNTLSPADEDAIGVS